MTWDPIALIEALAETVAVYEPDGTFVYANATTERLFGRSRDQLIGSKIWDLYPTDRGNRFHQAFQRVVATGQPESFDHHYLPWDRWYRNQIIPIDGKIHVIASDITPEKRAEEAARQADRRKDEFLAMLGHELRNPLAPILTALQLIQLRGAHGVERELPIIERQTRHLVRLVDDLLDISRITRGKIELKRTHLDLADVLAKAIETASPILEKRGHRLEISVPRDVLRVHGDEVRLWQVFRNLVTNAAKYTPPGGNIRVGGTVQGAQARVSVEDNGAGIPPALLTTIFEPFVQGERTADRAEGGLGIGLSLVRSIVGLHGGEVSAHSEGPGRGSRFEVRLPLLVDAAQQSAPKLDPTSGAVPLRRRVLLVDDNPDAAELLAVVLEDAGHRVLVAHDGPSALREAPDFEPDVALLDIGLPVMDGYELANHLRDALSPSPIFIALTGYGQEHDRERSRDAGFAEHLVKPVDAGLLIEVVSRAAPKQAPGRAPRTAGP